jgi:multidrug efflux pump subunit AcrB
MDLAGFCLRNRLTTIFITMLLVLGGIFCFSRLGMLEDPEFTIKTAVIYTPYPGATPEQVLQEVTNKVEDAVQQMGEIKHIRSLSRFGSSTIYVDIQDKYLKDELPEVWTRLRHKVGDMQYQLPPGAGPSVVNDDYGDVYGMYYALVGPGYSYLELRDVAESLKKELVLVDQVAKVVYSGSQQEAIFVEISRSRLDRLGSTMQTILGLLQQQNLVTSTGNVHVGSQYLRIDPTGGFESIEEIGDLLVPGEDGSLVRLGDVAKIYHGYVSPASQYDRFDGEPAVTLGISTVSGGNVVVMGEAVERRLQELKDTIPLGMELRPIEMQSREVVEAVRGFVINLIESVVIVIGLLLVFMGPTVGMIIGGVLLVTILVTFIFMFFMQISLQQISLSALIIALGMLVDNAIVVAEGVLVGVEQGQEKEKTALQVVKDTKMALLGATCIAILAFSSIAFSNDSSGEYLRSLFQVVAISLGASWVLAITITPLFCVMFIRPPKEGEAKDPYGSAFFRLFRSSLEKLIRFRYAFMLVLVGLLVLAVFSFRFVEKIFFPPSTRSECTIDFWMPEGTHIDDTLAQMRVVEDWLDSQEEVDSYSTFAGGGALRFTLTYSPADSNSAYGQFIVSLREPKDLNTFIPKAQREVENLVPQARPIQVKRFSKGSGSGPQIEARLSGPREDVLRDLANQVRKIMLRNPHTMGVTDDWRMKVKVLRPIIAENQAKRAGLTRPQINQAVQMAYDGYTTGLFREEDQMLPIKIRLPEDERGKVENVLATQIWSPNLQQFVPLGQVVRSLETTFENASLRRRDRMLTLTVQCDPVEGYNTQELFNEMASQIEAVDLPPGYVMEWGGDHESSRDAQAAVMKFVPLSFLLMVMLLVMLFNSFRQPVILFLTLSLSIIGVTLGLLLLRQPFSFVALLGLLSLAGMLLKNGIVLLDQVNLEIREGKPPYEAVVHSTITRIRPVMMAAMTTVLGMSPLIFDDFFAPLAVTIMFGLTFATLLTLLVVPVLYCIFFNLRREEC